MRFITFLFLSLAIITPSFGENQDFMRFKNGDLLHGTWLGFDADQTTIWKRSDLDQPAKFAPQDIQRIILRNKTKSKLPHPNSHIELINGDQLPGTIKSLTPTTLTLDTQWAGKLTIPLPWVKSISPNAHGGQLVFYGIKNPSDWLVLTGSNKANQIKKGDIQAQALEPNFVLPNRQPAPNPLPTTKPWLLRGSSWYSQSSVFPLVAPAILPDSCSIKFRLAWKNQKHITILLHANPYHNSPKKEKPEPKAPSKEIALPTILKSQSFSRLNGSTLAREFGPCYALIIRNNYHVELRRHSLDEKGVPKMTFVPNSMPRFYNRHARNSTEDHFEIRCSRNTDEIQVFVNGRSIYHLTDSDHYVATGDRIAFAINSPQSQMRLSELIVTKWNGLGDSANSYQQKEHDTVLLTSGIDRFSGKITTIKDEKVSFKGRYCNLTFPLSEIQKITFATDQQKPESPDHDRAFNLILSNGSSLTLLDPVQGDSTHLTATHDAIGPITIDSAYANVLEFSTPEDDFETFDPPSPDPNFLNPAFEGCFPPMPNNRVQLLR